MQQEQMKTCKLPTCLQLLPESAVTRPKINTVPSNAVALVSIPYNRCNYVYSKSNAVVQSYEYSDNDLHQGSG